MVVGSDETFNEAYREIQTQHFTTVLNFASGTRTFVSIVRESNPYRQFRACFAADPELYSERAGRILQVLTGRGFDPQYCNPADEPLSTVVLALLDHGFSRGLVKCLSEARGCYWLPQIFEKQELIAKMPQTSSEKSAAGWWY